MGCINCFLLYRVDFGLQCRKRRPVSDLKFDLAASCYVGYICTKDYSLMYIL